jgi:hypothetical protein
MPILPLAFILVVATALACSGWFFLFRTIAIVEMNQRVLQEGWPWSKLRLASLAGKRWFPLMIRCQGMLSWLTALLLFGLAGSELLRR